VLETGELQSEDWFWRVINLNTHRGGQAGIGGFRNREGLDQPFAIRPGIVIAAGTYTFSGIQGELRTNNQRPVAARLNFSSGGFYNGDRTQYNAGIEWRPNSHVNMSMNYNLQQVSLPQGDFVTRLIGVNANYAFNSKWSWINLVQYDNASNVVGLNSRLRWNPQAGEDLYLVVNYNLGAEGAFMGMNPQNSEIVLKYTKTLRF
jgi:hypothetical protein